MLDAARTADLHTLRRAAAGDAEATSALVERLGPLVWSICRRLAADGAEAEDSYQEVWEKTLRALPGFDIAGPAALSTWVATIAHRHMVDRHRRRVVRGEVVPLPDLPAPTPGVDRLVDHRRGVERQERALAGLSDEQRRAVVLHEVHGMSAEDIARTEAVPVGTIKSRLHRGRARLVRLIGGVL